MSIDIADIMEKQINFLFENNWKSNCVTQIVLL